MDRIWIELDREALKHNIESYQAHLPEYCKIMGVVKANSYGLGGAATAVELKKLGIDHFATASLAEAIEVRKAGITEDILILGYTDPSNFHLLTEYDLTQIVSCPEYGDMLRDYCNANKAVIKGHIAVDTGMHRLGFFTDQLEEIKEFYAEEYLKITGILSHLCVGDSDAEEHIEFSELQARRFEDVLNKLRADGIELGTIHFESSYPAVNYPHNNYDYARLGILMFGLLSSDADWLKYDLNLKPVMTLKVHIAAVRWIEPGETVSYGRTFTATRPTKVATLAVGYADGIPRNLSGGKLKSIIGGKLVSNLGRICMDQLMMDVTEVDDVKVGDEAILIGSSGGVTIRAEDVAADSGTITNELVSRLGARIEGRFYK